MIQDFKNEDYPNFFWLHFRKSAGTSVKSILDSNWNELDGSNVHRFVKKNPPSLLQVEPKFWNSLINIPNVNLGNHSFKRSLFARDFLYKDNWENMFSFAFSLEPTDIAVSMFYYLMFSKKLKISILTSELLKNKKLYISTSSKFDLFLDWVEKVHQEGDLFVMDRIFHTHTAPMHGDITDNDNNIILKKVYRLENFNSAFIDIANKYNLNLNYSNINKMKNLNVRRKNFSHNHNQMARIKEIYSLDFDVYENAY